MATDFETPYLDYSAPPTAELVEAKIRGANWWPEDEAQISFARLASEMAVRGSVKRFLRIVRWEPFIANGRSETRYLTRIDEEGRIQLGEGLLELESCKVLGRNYIPNQTVFAEPANAALANRPYTYLQLWGASGTPWGNNGYHHTGQAVELRPRAIEVTGTWGYSFVWPEDAFEAIVSRAAALTLSSVNQESELSSLSEDGYSETYDLVGPIDQKTALTNWGTQFEAVAVSYAKPRPGAMTLNTAPQAGRNMRRNYLPTV